MLASILSSKPHVVDSVVAKAIVAWEATVLNKDLGFQQVVLEGDALQIVQALQRGGWKI